MFDFIGDLFKKIFEAIKKILVYVLLIIAVILFVWATIATGGATLAVFGFAISTTAAMVLAGVAVVAAFLIDPETASEVVGKVGEALGDAAEAVGEAAGNIVGGATSGLFSSSLGTYALMAGGAFLLYKLATSDSSNEAVTFDEDGNPIPVEDKSKTSLKSTDTEDEIPLYGPGSIGYIGYEG